MAQSGSWKFVAFSCQAARDKYLVHPLHEEFLAAHKKRLQDLCVFDYLAAISGRFPAKAQLLALDRETLLR